MAVQSETTTLPVVTTAENGSGVATTESQYFDAAGNTQWVEDGNGRWTYSSYDPVTGLLSYTIADITAGMASSLGLAPPAALPSTGIDARTDYSYDPLGRVTQVLGPAFVDNAGDLVRTATYYAYIDYPLALGTGQGEGGQGTEALTASGFYVVTPATGSAYAAGDFVLTNPVSITIGNLDDQTTDEMQGEIGTGLTVVETSSAAMLAELSTASFSAYSRWTHNDYATQADTTHGYYGVAR